MQKFKSLILLLLLLVAAFTNGAEIKQNKNEKRGLPIPVPDHSGASHLLAASSGPTPPAVRPVSVTVHRSYPVAVPQPYAVHVPKPYPVTVHVPKPYPVAVPHPVPVAVPVPHPVPLVVRQQIGVPIAVPKPYPIPVPHPIPVPSPVLLGHGPSFPEAEYHRAYLPLTGLGAGPYLSLGAATRQESQLGAEYARNYPTFTAAGPLTPEQPSQDNEEVPSSPPSAPPATAPAPSGEDVKDSPPPPPPPSLSPPPTDTPAYPSHPPSTFHFTPNFKL